jgi:hypothetical protein
MKQAAELTLYGIIYIYIYIYIYTKFYKDWCRRSSNFKVLLQKFERL